jgi:hypothetical protein
MEIVDADVKLIVGDCRAKSKKDNHGGIPDKTHPLPDFA